MASTTYTVQIHEEDGTLWAEVLELPGCFVTAEHMEELPEALSEAISLVVEHPVGIVRLGPAESRVEVHHLELLGA